MATTGLALGLRFGRPTPRNSTRALLWRHPEWALAGASALAWVWLAAVHWINHDEIVGDFSFDVMSWGAMVLAMMVPGVLPMARYVAFNSLWRRRNRAMGLFVSAYAGVWLGFGVAAWGLVALVDAATGWTAAFGRLELAIAGAVAVAWQFTAGKHRALRRCHLRKPVGAHGWPADRAALRYGLFHARACVGSCWAIMAMMFVAQHNFHLMVPLAVVAIVERYQRRPSGLPGAAGIAVAAVLAVM